VSRDRASKKKSFVLLLSKSGSFLPSRLRPFLFILLYRVPRTTTPFFLTSFSFIFHPLALASSFPLPWGVSSSRFPLNQQISVFYFVVPPFSSPTRDLGLLRSGDFSFPGSASETFFPDAFFPLLHQRRLCGNFFPFFHPPPPY